MTYWLTPRRVYEELDSMFRFDFDPAPHPRPKGFDGLKSPWGKSNFVNPPYGDGGPGVGPWVRKALAEAEQGNGSVLLLPMDPLIHAMFQQGFPIPLAPFEWEAPDGIGKRSAEGIVAFRIAPRQG